MKIKKHTNYTRLSFLKQLLNGQYFSLGILVLIQIISGICPIVVNYLISQLIDAISMVKAVNTQINYFRIDHITILILVSIIFLLLGEVFSVMHGFFFDYFEEYIYQRVKSSFLYKISLYPTNYFFEDSRICDLIALSKKNIFDISSYISIALSFLGGLFLLIPALIAAWTLEWWIPLVLIMTLTPLIYFRIKFQKQTWDVQKNFSSLFKQIDIYEECLTSANYSKDIRLYNMQSGILDSWNNCYSSYLAQVNKIRKTASVTIRTYAKRMKIMERSGRLLI